MFISETRQINISTRNLVCWRWNLNVNANVPSLLVANVVSDDVPVAELGVGLVPHHVQLCGVHCTHSDVPGSPLWPLPVSDELQNVTD